MDPAGALKFQERDGKCTRGILVRGGVNESERRSVPTRKFINEARRGARDERGYIDDTATLARKNSAALRVARFPLSSTRASSHDRSIDRSIDRSMEERHAIKPRHACSYRASRRLMQRNNESEDYLRVVGECHARVASFQHYLRRPPRGKVFPSLPPLAHLSVRSTAR